MVLASRLELPPDRLPVVIYAAWTVFLSFARMTWSLDNWGNVDFLVWLDVEKNPNICELGLRDASGLNRTVTPTFWQGRFGLCPNKPGMHERSQKRKRGTEH